MCEKKLQVVHIEETQTNERIYAELCRQRRKPGNTGEKREL